MAQWVARIWWDCNYHDIALFNRTGYYYLPEVRHDKQSLQRLIDGIHTICFTIGGAIGGFTGQYWYSFLTRSVSCIFIFVDSIDLSLDEAQSLLVCSFNR